jgi:peptide/nickel transport system permease protein
VDADADRELVRQGLQHVTAYLLRRFALTIGVLLAISYLTFVVVATQFSSTCSSDYTPSGAFPPLAATLGDATKLYLDWLKGLPSGDSFGNVCGAPVTQDITQALGHTGALLGMTLLFVVVFSLLMGLLAAARAGTWLDLGFRGFSYTAWAIPPFLLALVLQSVLIWMGKEWGFHFFPESGWPGACIFGVPGCVNPEAPHGWDYAGQIVRFLVVPSMALAVAFVGVHSRYLRSALLTSLSAPYTTTARAKGVSERRVVVRHALRNSLGAFVSVLLLDFGAIVGAALAVDWVFRMNGMGLLFLSVIGGLGSQSGDGPKFLDAYAVMAVLTVIAVMVAAASLLAEVVVLWLDPRARPA